MTEQLSSGKERFSKFEQEKIVALYYRRRELEMQLTLDTAKPKVSEEIKQIDAYFAGQGISMVDAGEMADEMPVSKIASYKKLNTDQILSAPSAKELLDDEAIDQAVEDGFSQAA